MEKMITIKKIVKIFILVVFILTVIFLVLSPFLAIGYEYLLIKWDIDNPYVNNNFKGWKTVTVEEFSEILLPEDWSLIQEDGVITIFVVGEEWAKGTVLKTEESRFGSESEFLYWLTGVDALVATPDPMPEMRYMKGSDIIRYHTELEGFKTYYAMYLEDRSKNQGYPTLILITTCPIEPETKIFNITEAIVYGFACELVYER